MLNGISQESWIRCGIAVVTSLTSVWLTYTYMQKGGLWRRKKITDSDSSGGGQQHHPDEKVVSSTLLRKYCESVFKHYGINEQDAKQAADVLILADLRGIDSHGVARLKAYTELLEAKQINVNPKLRIVAEQPGFAIVDGDNGLGLVVAPRANRMAIERAKQYGCGAIAVCNTNHFGIAGYYSIMAAEEGCIGMAMTNSTPLVGAHGGKGRILGTNPIAVTFPSKDKADEVTVDMATSTAAYGKIEIAHRHGKDVPMGWATNSDGLDTTLPRDMMHGGSLLPLGSDKERAGHKGYCLASVVDIFTGVVSGANYGPFTPPFTLKDVIANTTTDARRVGKGIGHFFTVYNLPDSSSRDRYSASLRHWKQTMRECPPRPGFDRVRVPGDPEQEAYDKRRRGGIHIHPGVLSDLREISQTTGVPLPF